MGQIKYNSDYPHLQLLAVIRKNKNAKRLKKGNRVL